jgi:hypothetical protein
MVFNRRMMMKNWFTSLNTAITFSVIALLTELWRGFLDAAVVIGVEFKEGIQPFALIFTLLISSWAWALIAAARGKRAGVVVAFVINAMVLLVVPVSWLFFYCPAACRATAGIFNLANSLNLVFGVLAAIPLGVQLFARKAKQSVGPAGAEA